jgi:acyl-coenzyme A synthetase/AMP-(fatty) acid ligase
MSAGLPLIAGFAAHDRVGWSGGEPVSATQFCSAAAELAGRLPPRRFVINRCHDRLKFALGLAAALIARQTSLLPPSGAAGALQDLLAAHPDGYCLADDAELPAGMPAILVPPFREATGAFDVPLLPAAQVAYIAFTSGSTGRPQPHSSTWGSLVGAARRFGQAAGLMEKRGAVLGTVPPQHVYGLETTVIMPLQLGSAIHPGRPLLPADIGAALQELPEPRWMVTTPAHLRTCVGAGAALPPLAGILCATMPLTEELATQAEALSGAPVHEFYGSTETGVIATRRTAHAQRWRTCEGIRLESRGEETWAAGGHLLAPARLPDRIALIGTESGATQFTLLGRPEDMVKIAGKRASLEELNRQLLGVRGVRDGVFFQPEARGTRTPRLAALVVAPGCTARDILAALRGHIDAAFLPRPLLIVEALPRNATGKVTREALLALARATARGRRSA